MSSYTITEETQVHRNNSYMVLVNDDADGYGVINIATGVTEFEAISLPECIFAAENLDVVLTYKTYEWVGKRAEAQQSEDRKTSAAAAGIASIN